MADPLSQVIQLLRPRTVFSKGISGAGRWGVRYSQFGQPGFCVVLEGRCRLAVDGEEPVVLEEGDFVLLPATPAFVLSSLEPVTPRHIDPKTMPSPAEEVRHGRADGPADVRLLGGYFIFDSPDAALLVSLLPAMVHVRGIRRLSVLVRLVGEEASGQAAGRDLVLARLVEVLLIEALRATRGDSAQPGLLRGLADARIAAALRQMHGRLRAILDRCAACKPSGNVALGILRPVHAHRRTETDGISSCLADGGCERPPAERRDPDRRDCKTGRLRLGKHLQHRV